MPSSTPLSYQTTMPEFPDVSYEAYRRYALGDLADTKFGKGIVPVGGLDYATYGNWRQTQLDKYNAAMSAYNTWLGTGEGQRASLESGGYNASYFQGQNASASPLNYSQSEFDNSFSDMAQGVQGILSFASALQGLKLMSTQIRGQEIKNAGQQIENDWKDRLLNQKYLGLGFQNDWRAQQVANALFPMYRSMPELWKSGAFVSPHTGMTYDLSRQEHSLGYQKSVQDLDYLKAGTFLRNMTGEMASWNAKEKKWYSENMWEIQKGILQGTLTYQNGEIDFQKVSQKLRKASVIAGIGKDVLNTALNAFKTFSAGGLLSGPSQSAPTWGNFPWQSQSWMPGVDIDTGSFYPSWNN